MFEYVNYYGVEKYFSYRDCEFYLIPYEYKVGTYKIDEIDYIKYDSKDFIELDEIEKRKILKENMLWIAFGSYVSNGFSEISVSNMEMLNITYKNIGKKKIGMLWEVVNCNNKDDFYRYVERDTKEYDKIVEECANIVYEEINSKLKKDYRDCEISKMFLDFFGDYEAPVINCTIVCDEDIRELRDKYSYDDYFNKRYKGIKLFKKFVSYREDYEKYIAGILSNGGSYKNCVYELSNVDRVFSYYTSLFEYDYFQNGNICSEFLNLVCNKAREKLLDNLDEFKLADDFNFFDVEEWD